MSMVEQERTRHAAAAAEASLQALSPAAAKLKARPPPPAHNRLALYHTEKGMYSARYAQGDRKHVDSTTNRP